VPLTLLSLDDSHQDLVAEVGTNNPGEIKALADLVAPRTAMVTNVGYAHVGNFGSQEALADEKASIYTAVPADGVWFVPSDDPLLNDAVARLHRPESTRVVTFGSAPGADVRVSEIEIDEGSTSGLVTVGNESRRFTLPLVGRHFATTVAAAVAVAVERGTSLSTAVDRLSSFPGTEGRASMSTIRGGSVLLIDDTYNGSPDSMMAALDTLATFDGRRRVAVLGEMRELGTWSTTLHEAVGAKVGGSADDLVFIGPSEAVVRAAATRAGMDAGRIRSAASAVEAGRIVEQLLDTTDGAAAVLVKGSRFIHAERVPLMLQGVDVRCPLDLCELYIHCSTCPQLSRPVTDPPSA
jgi:UDP-N-acetylmuramoyl-tripeptide--D-alanyl-D-alanine ligase